MMLCPCGTGRSYQDCCEPFIAGKITARTTEALMRSRYSAFARSKMAYILHTMRSPAADHFKADAQQQDNIKWTGLEVIRTATQGNKGWVEFKAHYTKHSMPHVLHELSEFHLRAGIWYYVDGQQPKPVATKAKSAIGRNESCPCGSGKKYKKCCGY
jgi:SEC-C motif-containing protein